MIFYFLFRGWKTFEFLKFILKLKLQGLDTEIQFFLKKDQTTNCNLANLLKFEKVSAP
jgi:hypothetical protein